MSAIGAAHGGTQSEATFSEIQAIANGATDTVVGDPANIFLRYTALEHEVFNKSTDRIVGQCGNNCCIQPKAPPKASCHVIFAAAFPGAEMAGSRNSFVAWVKAQHHLTQTDEIPHTSRLRFDRER